MESILSDLIHGWCLLIRARVLPGTLADTVQRITMELDTHQPVYAIQTMDGLLAASVLRRLLIMLLLAAFAGAAAVLAALGIYGVISYWVAQRRHEIGIRMALGASRSRILEMVVRESVFIVGIGVIVGLASAVGLTRLLATMLFNVGATDIPTFVTVGLSMMAVGLLASLAPALRATLVNPISTLRKE